jgi:pentapeptide MXKDX repeat protein
MPNESRLNRFLVSDFFDRDAIDHAVFTAPPKKGRAASRCGEAVTGPRAAANCCVRSAKSGDRGSNLEPRMRILATKLLIAASMAMLAGAPSFAEEAGTTAAEPMKTDQMSTDAMSANPMAADPMKADCLEKAQSETDAAKKEAMVAECDAMGGSMMMMAPKQ